MKIEYIINNNLIELLDENLEVLGYDATNNFTTALKDYTNLSCFDLNAGTKQNHGAINEKKEYIVKPLDTIYTISKKIGLCEEKLKKILNGETLYIGKKIIY